MSQPPRLRALPRLANRHRNDGEIGELLTGPMSIEYFDDIVTVTR